MKKKFVEGDEKIILRNKNTENKDTWKTTQKTKKNFEAIIKSFSYNKLLARCPTMLVGWIFIACFFYPGIDMKEVFKSWPVFVSVLIVTAFWLCLIFYDENKYKRLYKQVCNWTITIKQLPIVKFKRYRPRRHFNFKYDNSNYGYRIIVSDWNKKYKSRKYSDRYLWLNNILTNTQLNKDSLKINGKIYYIWDTVTVFIDSKRENNYYIDI